MTIYRTIRNIDIQGRNTRLFRRNVTLVWVTGWLHDRSASMWTGGRCLIQLAVYYDEKQDKFYLVKRTYARRNGDTHQSPWQLAYAGLRIAEERPIILHDYQDPRELARFVRH